MDWSWTLQSVGEFFVEDHPSYFTDLAFHMIFEYLDTIDTTNAMCVIIPSELSSFDELFSYYYETLNFPGYVGKNWNALADCLTDLSWIKTQRIVIFHKEIPLLPNQDILIYLELLEECANDWKDDNEHSLVIGFSPELKTEVLALLKTIG